MGLFSKNDINDGIAEYQNTPGAILVDVRESSEYLSGHIPGAVNLPLSRIREIDADLDTPIFVHCLRGPRAAKAADVLRLMDYENVKRIGGIAAYKGVLEK